jgi:hypothetical protein
MPTIIVGGQRLVEHGSNETFPVTVNSQTVKLPYNTPVEVEDWVLAALKDGGRAYVEVPPPAPLSAAPAQAGATKAAAPPAPAAPAPAAPPAAKPPAR